MAFNYSVAIRLSVANLASAGVRLLAADLLKAHGAATNLQSRLAALKLAAVGYGMSKAGDGILGFLHKSVDASKDMVAQLSLMNAAGMTQRDIAQATAGAYRTSSDVMTTTVAENLKAIRELRSVFGAGKMGEILAVLPTVQRTKASLEALTGKEQEGVAFDMIKAIELGTKGAVTQAGLLRQSDEISRALMAFGGTLTVRDFHQAIKQSRAMAPYLSEEFKYLYMPTLMQELKTGPNAGAVQAGTAIASLGQVVVGQMIPKALITNWISSGLISADKIVRDPHNRTTSKVLPGGVIGQNEFAENPYLWAQRYAKPAVERLMAQQHLDQYGAILALTHNRVAAFALQTLINKSLQFERDKQLILKGGTGYQTYQKLAVTNPMLAEMAMHKQYQNILATIGYVILPKMLPFMVRFAGWLASLNQWMSQNPEKTKAIVIGLGVLGIALSLVGKLLMGIALLKFLGMVPMIIGLVTRLGTALAALFLGSNPIGWTILIIVGIMTVVILLYRNWSTIKPFLLKIGEIVGNAFRSAYNAVVHWMSGLLDWVGNSTVGKVLKGGGKSWLDSPVLDVLPGGWLVRAAGQLLPGATKGAPAKVPPAGTGKPGPAQGHVYLDSKKVGNVMWKQGAAAGFRGPLRSGYGFDHNSGPAPVGLGR
jgi:hypothetical protein